MSDDARSWLLAFLGVFDPGRRWWPVQQQWQRHRRGPHFLV